MRAAGRRSCNFKSKTKDGCTMIQNTVTYFEKPGRENTEATLKLAVEAARALGILNLVVASTDGGCAQLMADSIDHEGVTVTVVTHAYGQIKPNWNPMPMELRRRLIDKGFNVCTAAHVLSGAERSLSNTFKGVYPVEIIAHTLRMFGQGTKVCAEICAMAADAGSIMSGEPVVAVGGTGRGADTALVLRPQVSCNVLQTKIDRIICMPIE